MSEFQSPLIRNEPRLRARLISYSRFLPIVGRIFLTEAMSMSTIKQPAGRRYRERQRAARWASRRDVPTPRHHAITVAAAQRMHRGVSFSIADDGLIADRTVIQSAST